MKRLKVAILEDNKEQLKALKQNLEETELVEVVAWALNSEDFLNKVDVARPEALLLDIDLGGDSMNGLDIAYKLKLPVLFISGRTKDFYERIEEININSEIPVEHITKPATTEKLKRFLPKFINEINSIKKAKFVHLDFADSKRNKIAIDKIVFLETETGKSGLSNNKRIHFEDCKSEVLYDFSFSKMEEKGFSKNIFIQIHKSFRVNADKIIRYNKAHEVEVEVFKSLGKTEIKKLLVSENFRSDVSRFKK